MIRSQSFLGIRSALPLLLAPGVLMGCSSTASSIPQTELTTARFVDVTCAVPCGTASVEAAAFADHAVGTAAAWFGIEAQPVGRLHLARDEREYAAIERRVTRGRFRTNLAFSHPAERLSVVAIQPPLTDGALAESALPMQTLRLSAHEAFHLTSYVAMPPPRRVPGWLEEGLATLVEADTRAALGRAPADPGEDPLLSTYYLRTGEAVATERMPAIGDLLRDRAGELTGSEVYAIRAVFFRSLVDADSASVHGALAAAVRTHRDGGAEADVTAAFVEAFGGLERMGEVFRTHLAASEPKWHEKSRSLETGGAVWVQHPFAAGAHAVRTRDAGRRWSLGAAVRLHGTDPIAGITLHDAAGLWGFVRIGQGEIRVVRDAPREVLVALPLGEGAAMDEPLSLDVSIDGQVIRVDSPAGELGPVDAGTELSGPWGLYTWGGGWVEWRGVGYESR